MSFLKSYADPAKDLYKLKDLIGPFTEESEGFLQALTAVKYYLFRQAPADPEVLDEVINTQDRLYEINFRETLQTQIKSLGPAASASVKKGSLSSYMLEDKDGTILIIDNMITEILRARTSLSLKISEEYLKRML